MANVRVGNSVYVDSTGNLGTDPVKVVRILVTATAASAVVVLADAAASSKKFDLRVATSGETVQFDFTLSPVLFPGGVKVVTLTNAIVTVIYN